MRCLSPHGLSVGVQLRSQLEQVGELGPFQLRIPHHENEEHGHSNPSQHDCRPCGQQPDEAARQIRYVNGLVDLPP